MPGDPTVIYSAANTQQAYLLKGLLEERGIAARVVNDAIQMSGGELPLGWTAAPRVVVAEDEAPKARQIAVEFERRIAHESASEGLRPPLAEEEFVGEDEQATWPDWPVCPACGERRSAQCPVCAASGISFPVADVQELADARRVLLFCSECDDHFVPQWYRHCHRCGHDYGDGLNADLSRHLATRQMWLVIGVLFAGALAFGAYFVWLF